VTSPAFLSVPVVRRVFIFVAVSAVSIAFDQWTKQVATAALRGQPARIWFDDLFRLQWATNEGAFLSLGASLPPTARYWLLTLGVGALLLALSIYSLSSKALDLFQVGSYALIASGGFSNWVDRARFNGVVVDFMNMGIGSLRTGVFNVADLAILVGIGLLFIHSSRLERLAKQAKAEQAAQAPKEP
jgi:signal peptidase II